MSPRPLEKMLVFGELHAGTREESRFLLGELKKVIAREKPTQVVCTGDFDHPEMALGWSKLEADLRKRRVSVLTLMGNHDYALANPRAAPVFSSTLSGQGIASTHELRPAYAARPEAVEYLRGLLEHSRWGVPQINFAGRKLALAHGGVLPEQPVEKQMAQRFFKDGTPLKREHEKTLAFLTNTHVDALIRGHDHLRARSGPREGKIEHASIPQDAWNHSETLRRGERSVFTHGAFYDGNYLTVTPADKGALEFAFKRAFRERP